MITIIPPEQLPAETRDNLLVACIVRESTDYGAEEISVAEKLSQLKQQLAHGEVVITYCSETESVNLVPANTPELQQAWDE